VPFHYLSARDTVLLPIKAALKQLSFFIQQDCSQWELDAPVPKLPSLEEFNGPVGRYETILEIIQVTTSFKLSGKEGGIKLNPSATPALNQRSISSTIRCSCA
jgi:hypothetical protein